MKKVKIINNNGIEIEVSPLIAELIHNSENINNANILVHWKEKTPLSKKLKINIDEIPLNDQIEYLELMCFATPTISEEERIKETLYWCYGINPIDCGNYYSVTGFKDHLLNDLKIQIKHKAILEPGNKNIQIILNALNLIIENKIEHTSNIDFEDLFYSPKQAYSALKKLKSIFPDLLTDQLHFNKGVKGVFPLFIKILKQKDIIAPHSDLVYKDALNKRIKNLNLTEDASEFRKEYKSIEKFRQDLTLAIDDMKKEFSQSSH